MYDPRLIVGRLSSGRKICQYLLNHLYTFALHGVQAKGTWIVEKVQEKGSDTGMLNSVHMFHYSVLHVNSRCIL